MIIISYPLTITGPLYPGTPPVTISNVKDIKDGATSTTSLISFSSHAGTHLDLPLHVCKRSGKDLPIKFGSIRNGGPCICMDIPIAGDNAIMPSNLQFENSNCFDIHTVLLRTGSWMVRTTDPSLYSRSHPWIHPDCVPVLRTKFPSLKVIGLDVISITNPGHKDAGREAHRKLLCEDPSILILEDLNLFSEDLLSGKMLITITPLIMDCSDGVPVFCFVEKMGDILENGRI